MFVSVGGAILAAGTLGAVGSVIAGSEQASGQKQAAQTQADMFNRITAQEQPFLNSGTAAEGSLNYLLGLSAPTGSPALSSTPVPGLAPGYLTQPFNPTQAQLESYPGYQFQQQQGQLATESAATPGTGALSGPALKSLMSFNQGLAASNYSNFFNQYQQQQNNIFNRLIGIAGIGQNAAGNLGNQGAQLGTGIAQAQAAAAGSQAAGIGGGIGSFANSLGALGIYSALNGNSNNFYPSSANAPSGGWSSGTDSAGTQ